MGNNMKTILGLDLGSTSIGWALIREHNNNKQIISLGSRIIPYEGTEGKDFQKGTGESRNALRTKARTARKGYDRYQLRRKYLSDILVKANMYPDESLKKLPKIDLWALRDKAVNSQITLKELGRLLLWLNQKRGYKSSRSDTNLGKKDTEYVVSVKSRHERIKELNQTIGQYFYSKLSNNPFYRVKDNIFPREAYIEEFDAICLTQKQFYPEVLNDKFISKVRNEIIYYQRPLKSQKGLVSICDFEGFWKIGKDNKEYFVGPKVAPKSSPIYQLSKIWENVNNIKLSTRTGQNIEITLEQKRAIFKHLDNNEKLTVSDLLKILGLHKSECYVNKQLQKGIIGNITKFAIKECFDNSSEYENLLSLNLDVIETEKKGYLIDKITGEVLNEKSIRYVNANVENEPFYKLWHTIYSIQDIQECSNTLQLKFGINPDTANKLANIDFNKYGFGNKSVKVIRKILPYLMDGDNYSDAMSYAGYNHSNSLTKDENQERKLQNLLKPISKNSLRQPIVEKILNQMVNVINALIEKYSEKDAGGNIVKYFKFDEIRVELARELKQSKEERNEADRKMSQRQRENENISKRLAEYGLRATRNNIIKWRLYEEIDNQDKKLNAICVYCGQPISFTEAIKGNEVDIEHIIPKSKLFDDSQSNKTLAHRKCNKDKNDRTSYDFMKSKPTEVFEAYVERVNSLYNNFIINKAKRDKLLMTEDKIPDNFIDRQLRESQYIARKSREILQTICYNVWATSGTVTAELRHLWGWDDVTMNLQFAKYKDVGLTETVEWESEHGKNKHQKEVISGWSKRDDHRHHAIDALTIACTKQGYIQRFNTLNAEKTREYMKDVVKDEAIVFNEKRSLLEKYIISEQPLTVEEVQNAVANILISYKAGKKVASIGKRKIGKRGNKKVVQTGIIIPRGALHEDGIYGEIKQYIKGNKDGQVDYGKHIVKKYKLGVGAQGFLFTGKETFETKQKIDKKTKEKYTVTVDKIQNVLDSIVDKGVRDAILKRINEGFPIGSDYKNNPKKALDNLKDLENKPIYIGKEVNSPIKSVRCFTGLSAVVPLKENREGVAIGFVKPGNNHHIAIYSDKEGNKIQHICTFWHAVERKKYKIPVVIKDSSEVWDYIQMQPEDTYPESFLEKLPYPQLNIELSLQQNEMFILGMTNDDVKEAIETKNYRIISDNLYRVQKMSIKPSSGQIDLVFRHHLETQIIDDANSKLSKRFINVQSLGALFSLNPSKVKVNLLGDIINMFNHD